jgi:hypothetical protein
VTDSELDRHVFFRMLAFGPPEVARQRLAPVQSDAVRDILGVVLPKLPRARRLALAATIEGELLPFYRLRTAKEEKRWAHAVAEIRRGLDMVSRAIESLGSEGKLSLRAGVLAERIDGSRGYDRVHFLTPDAMVEARRWLDWWQPPRQRGRKRKVDLGRRPELTAVFAGVNLAALFRLHGVKVTWGRLGPFAETLRVVLQEVGLPAPTYPDRLLDKIRKRDAQGT